MISIVAKYVEMVKYIEIYSTYKMPRLKIARNNILNYNINKVMYEVIYQSY